MNFLPWVQLIALAWTLIGSSLLLADATMPRVVVSPDGKHFQLSPGGRIFRPWGFNYDRDNASRLLEDYWKKEWSTVEEDFAEMKELGANVVRIHLQLPSFMTDARTPNQESLALLGKLVKVAEQNKLYLDITGLGCYHKQDVPAWYDALEEAERWDVQARFWQAVAAQCADSPAIFCYDLMNEPVSPAGNKSGGDWLGPPFGGKHYVQQISLLQGDRPRWEIAKAWIKKLTQAIREKDPQHLITVGMVDWSLDRPGLTSGFVPGKVAEDLDFISVHLYPEKGKLEDAMKTLEGFSIGKPIVIEETFPLKCSMEEFGEFVDQSQKYATGWIGFYWGKSPAELKASSSPVDSLMLGWLDFFTARGRQLQELP